MMKRFSPGSPTLAESNGKWVVGKFFQLRGIFSEVAAFLRRRYPPNATSTAAISQEMAFSVQTGLALRQQLAQSESLDDSFNLARKSFEISQSDARQLFNFILSRLPLLQMSLEQAPTFVRLMNIVARGSVYSPSRIDSLPQQVFINHS